MLRIFRSITSRFDVLGWSLMYLRWLARLVSDYRSFPSHLSLFACPQASVLKSQRRFSAAEQVRVRLVNEDLYLFSPFALTSTRLFPSSLIAFASLYTRGLILIGLITSPTHLHLLLSLVCLATHREILHLTFLSRYTIWVLAPASLQVWHGFAQGSYPAPPGTLTSDRD